MARPSLLGSGLLVRVRSTTLGLLGLTAAVGLGMVALGLNQSWPLLAGGPIPKLPGKGEPRPDRTNSGGNWQRVQIPPELRPGLLHPAPGARTVNRGSGNSHHEASAVEVAVSTPVSESAGGSPETGDVASESPPAQTTPSPHVQASPQSAPQAPAPSSPSNNQPIVSAPASSPQASSAAPENAVPPAPPAEEATDENGASAPSPPSPPGWSHGHGHGHH
jgi:hypothetical protein